MNNLQKLKKLISWMDNLPEETYGSEQERKLAKLKELLKEIQKVKLFEKIKSTKDIGAIVDILHNVANKPFVMKGEQGIQGEKGDKGERGEQGQKGYDGKDGRNGIDGKNGKDGRDGRDGVDGRDGEKGLQGMNGADGSPDQPLEIRNKLESLEDEEKLKISAIKDLEEELKKLKKQIDSKVVYAGGGGGGGGGHIVKAHDLSASLNGSTKVFSLPAFWRVISVHLSSFPNILRPTTDYTTDANLMQISFTAEIDAPTSLATNQSCIIIYSE